MCKCEFFKSCITAPKSDPPRGYCKGCWKARTQDRNRQGVWERYGIIGFTVADYDRLLKEQDGKCAICETTYPVGKNYDLDHNHKTGVVRGLICRDCNLMLGKAKDSPIVLLRAAEYLMKEELS